MSVIPGHGFTIKLIRVEIMSAKQKDDSTGRGKGTTSPVWRQIFKPGFVCYSPAEIKRIRQTLGESPEEFAQRFFVSQDAVKSWETVEGQVKHRECTGPAARLMYWAAVEANERGCSKNNLIRLGCRGGVE